ncbi:MAG TPA: BON domain-containing protein, partial [Polyangiaceae bacterium]|nr:BON domain-containing protein [Polyangiaceae bacterium]
MPFSATRTVAFALVLLGPSACHKSSSSAAPAASTPSAISPAPVVATPLADADIKAAVETKLRTDKKMGGASVAVGVRKGVVALHGKVDNLLSRGRATRLAEAVRGVRSVKNRIVVAPPPRSDQDIQRDVGKALLYNAATARMSIHATVRGGVVTLAGVADSWQEQRLAERIVDGVRGVIFTLNVLKNDGQAKRPDDAITNEVKRRLAWDALVEQDQLVVAVQNGRVTLSGIVGSAAERSRAVSDARVDGVADIDATLVEVAWRDRPDDGAPRSVQRADQDIAAAIGVACSYDPRLKASRIDARVVNGVATLTGTVDSPKARMAAEGLARNTVGVVSVDNELLARSKQILADHELETRIEDALAFDAMTEAHELSVAVKNGEVKLTGAVGTFFESAEAFDVASRLAGVTRVDNQLQVRDPAVPYVHSAFLDPFTPYVESWYVSPRPLGSDAVIAARVRAELDWSPFVQPKSVHVAVLGGKVRLTGNVHTFRERRAAAQSAL